MDLTISSDINKIIKNHVQKIFIFNMEFDKLLIEFKKKPYDINSWNNILPEWLSPSVKADIITLLPIRYVIHNLVRDRDLFISVSTYLNYNIINEILMSLIDDITIPLMLDCPIIFSNDIISKIKESESLDFFGVEPIYYIANYLTRSTFNKINLLNSKYIPSNSDDKVMIIKRLKPYVSEYVISNLINIFENNKNIIEKVTEKINNKLLLPIINNINYK